MSIDIKIMKTPTKGEVYNICKNIATKFWDESIKITKNEKTGNIKDLDFFVGLYLKENDVLKIETDDSYIIEDVVLIFNKIVPTEIIQ